MSKIKGCDSCDNAPLWYLTLQIPFTFSWWVLVWSGQVEKSNALFLFYKNKGNENRSVNYKIGGTKKFIKLVLCGVRLVLNVRSDSWVIDTS